jgi:hypothetical protein
LREKEFQSFPLPLFFQPALWKMPAELGETFDSRRMEMRKQLEQIVASQDRKESFGSFEQWIQRNCGKRGMSKKTENAGDFFGDCWGRCVDSDV